MARYQDARNDHADDQDITSAGRGFNDGIRNFKQRTTSFFGATPELGDRVVNGLNAFSRATRRAGEDAMSKVKKYAIWAIYNWSDKCHRNSLLMITTVA